MEVSEFEKKRAANLIWSAARNYDIEPVFRVYDSDGKADLYWNCVIGSVCLHYEWPKLQAFYRTFEGSPEQGMYENLFWIALENAAYSKEEKARPVFPYLRREYAKNKLREMPPGSVQNRIDGIFEGHLRHAVGQDSGLPDVTDRKLLDAIEIGPDQTTEQIIESLRKTFTTWFAYAPNDPDRKRRKNAAPALLSLAWWKHAGKDDNGPFRHFAFGFGERLSEGGSIVDQSHLKVSFAKYAQQTDEGLRDYVRTCFGKPSRTDEEIRRLEKECCTGNHRDVHLLITRGETDEALLAKGGFAAEQRKRSIAQEKANTEAYHAGQSVNRLAVERLTNAIRNSMLVHLESQTVKSSTGRLMANRIWRGLYLNDAKVFRKELRGDAGNLSVDILLDASTSQIRRQETVAAQGYIIAEALTRCRIPVRVSSFCSLNGYMVMTVYRDYMESGQNSNIFRYFTSGANRDGLAVRLISEMIRKNHADHRILILLSDCKPNDMIKMRGAGGSYLDYADRNAVEDTASEVHQARMNGITVLGVFTGNDAELPAVRRIYDRSFVRIRSLEMFADAVGGLLQSQISAL
jgi:hypothetical protein